jgi:hypothetical protein
MILWHGYEEKETIVTKTIQKFLFINSENALAWIDQTMEKVSYQVNYKF